MYHCARRLLLQLLASTKKADRIFRYGAIADTVNMILAVMTDIAFADKYDIDPAARVSFITTARMKMDEIKVRICVLYDARALRKPGFSALTDLESKTDAQLEKWEDSTRQLINTL